MHEHVVGDGHKVALHAGVERDDHLEATHVSRVPGILQTVLVALEEELEKVPGKRHE